ncbi:MAG TPA: response regulator transcription factor [Chitinophagaceae bacterium]|nr:response regulator transcription factor [Chitinophagaceae bacterium]HNF71245.1 response regulator transcription factor [Chitinophagaceae bacterium]
MSSEQKELELNDAVKTQKSKILLVEDDLNFGKVLKNYLELNDYVVELVRDGILGLAAFRREKYDLCLLDVMMPNLDGFALAEEIRNIDLDIPLFFLTAKNMKEDILNGYRLGADDYILKPFDSEILLHKIKAILKRNQEKLEKQNENFEFTFGRFHLNAKLRELKIDDKLFTLSPKENALLRMLCEHRNDLLPRDQVLKKIWGSDTYFNGRSMDVYIAKLRKLLKEDESVEIVNIHGNGFRLVVPES